MYVLGIETSCDETAASVVLDGKNVLSSVVASQDNLHVKWGGVIPEIASRAHVQAVVPVVAEAFQQAGISRDQIDSVAVSARPGLLGSLLIGVTFAKGISFALGKPLTGVNHIEAHVFAANLESDITYPAVSFAVSGGHTALFYSESLMDHRLIGSTIDDAAGEAFDKVASILGLGYPGGPVIDRTARAGDRKAFQFPRSLIREDSYRFSFSGIKTAVLYHCQGHTRGKDQRRDISTEEKADIAASFQEAVVDVLVAKAVKAVKDTGAESLVIGGGVACNSRLRERLSAECPCTVHLPSICYCIDNGAMIAGLGYYRLQAGIKDSLELEADPTPVRM